MTRKYRVRCKGNWPGKLGGMSTGASPEETKNLLGYLDIPSVRCGMEI